jgi:hypothetical protein
MVIFITRPPIDLTRYFVKVLEYFVDSIVNRPIQTVLKVYLSDSKRVLSILTDTRGSIRVQSSTVSSDADISSHFLIRKFAKIQCIRAHTQNQRIISP